MQAPGGHLPRRSHFAQSARDLAPGAGSYFDVDQWHPCGSTASARSLAADVPVSFGAIRRVSA
jgi:hypothetical protein